MSEPHSPDLSRDPDALTVRKRPIPLRVSFATEEGVCKTLEGPVQYVAGDALVTGTRDERWPVSREAFLARYHPVPPSAPGEDGLYVSVGTPCLAKQVPVSCAVRLREGDRLHAKAGDWLLQYGPGEYGVVSESVFRETYEAVSGQE